MTDASPTPVLRQMIMGFLATHLLQVMAELRLADLLKDGPRSSDELAVLMGAQAGALQRVLRGLAHLGVLSAADDRFELTPTGHLLRSDVPGSLRASARMWGSHFFQRAFLNLLHTVKTGERAFDYTFGQDFFGYLAEHPEDAAIFHEGMAGGSARSSETVLSKYDFSGVSTLVDVGGGYGATLVALLRSNPGLRGIIFDLPQLAGEAQQALVTAGLTSRAQFMAGSFFDAVPEAADGYLLQRILHDWDDPDSVTILRNCRQAMAARGKVLVVDHVLPPGNAPALRQVTIDIAMLVLLNGRERTEADFRRLFEQAGLRLVRTIPVEGEPHLLEAVPA